MSEIHGAVGSYVINALDPTELDEFEAHLAVCPTCSREVVEFCETAAELSLLASVLAPPPELRNSVMSAISGVRVLPPILPPLEGDDSDAAPRRAVPVIPDPEPVKAEAPVDELALRRARRRTRILSLAVAAAMVVALSLGGWAFSLNRAQQQQVASASLETQLLSAPDVKIYSAKMTGGGQGSFVVSKAQNKALFVGKGLPAVGNRTFQLWTVEGKNAPVPAGLVPGVGDQKTFLNVPVDAATNLAVSVEQSGGATAPTDIRGLTDPLV